jgi:hypothetical protein
MAHDEDDDVEGHSFNPSSTNPLSHEPMARDEDDDVEGHALNPQSHEPL